MIRDYVNYVLGNIKHRKVRAWLTMLGIIVGIAAVVSLISLGTGLQASVTEQFEMVGSDKIIVVPGASVFASASGGAAGIEITNKDIKVIEGVNGVSLVGGFISKIGQIKFKDEIKYTFVSGMATDESRKIVEDMQSFEIIKGRNLEEGDRFKAVIGIMLYEGDVFESKVNVRDKISIEGQNFKVIGVLGRIGNPSDDSQILIPLDIAGEVLNAEDAYTALMVQVKKGEDPAFIAEKIRSELRDSRNVDEGEEDFSVQTFEEIMETFGTVLGIVSAVLIGIAAISLLVGGIGIMNTMYTAVLQRTQEIGVMKAVGARNSDILKLFLIESGIYGLIGGSIGILIGVGIALGIVAIGKQYVGEALLRADISPLLIFGSLAFSFIVGGLSGVAPAYRASRLKPVDALRYE